jgi:hypothetical protein
MDAGLESKAAELVVEELVTDSIAAAPLPSSTTAGISMVDLFSTALAEQARQRTKQAVVLAEHARQQAVVDALLTEVSTMEQASPEEREALMAKIMASKTASSGAVAEEEEEEEESSIAVTTIPTTENEAASRPLDSSWSVRDGHLRRIRELAEVAEVRAAKVEELAESRYEEAKARSEAQAQEAADIAEHVADEAREQADEAKLLAYETLEQQGYELHRAAEEKRLEKEAEEAVVALEKKRRDDARCVLVARGINAVYS